MVQVSMMRCAFSPPNEAWGRGTGSRWALYEVEGERFMGGH